MARASRKAHRGAAAATAAMIISTCRQEAVELAGRRRMKPLPRTSRAAREIAGPVRLDRPVELRAAPQPPPGRGQQVARPVQRHLDDALVLPVQELLQRAEAGEGEERLALALDEQVELRRDVPSVLCSTARRVARAAIESGGRARAGRRARWRRRAALAAS